MAVFTSCEDYLEPAPTSVISGASFYADEAQLMQGVYNMYDGLKELTTRALGVITLLKLSIM